MIIIDRLMIMSTNPMVPTMVFPSLVVLRVPGAVSPAPARRIVRSSGRGMYLFGASPYLAVASGPLRVGPDRHGPALVPGMSAVDVRSVPDRAGAMRGRRPEGAHPRPRPTGQGVGWSLRGAEQGIHR